MSKIRAISAILGVVIALGASVPLTLKLHRTMAGTPALAAKIEMVAERLDSKIIQDRMEKLQERMWAMEDRWGERFAVEKNRIHDTMEELLHFMTEEARSHYRELQREYEKLERQLREREDNE